MKNNWINFTLLRIVLPLVLTGTVIWRPVGISLIYLVLILLAPFIPIPTHRTIKSHMGRYLKACLSLTSLITLTQIVFHTTLLLLPPYGYFLKDCEFLEKLFRHLGLVRLDGATVLELLFWQGPETVMLPTSIIIYCLWHRLNRESRGTVDGELLSQNSVEPTTVKSTKIKHLLHNIRTYITLASLCCTAALNPSIEGGFYFILFLIITTLWACNKGSNRGFLILCRIILMILILHILVLLSYQNQWPQELVKPGGPWSRYLALSVIYSPNCNNPRSIHFSNSYWSGYTYVLRLFWLYYILGLQSQCLESEPSVRSGSVRKSLLQESSGSAVTIEAQGSSIQLQLLTEGNSNERQNTSESIISAVYSVYQLIANSSYLITNIVMMTWSIMYHSWTTFVLLIWALILWMVPNKRLSMMKCSPFIVLYTISLLLVEYIYSMNLTDAELPSEIEGVDMSEIGFNKSDQQKFGHLIVKSLFLSMFLITLRHYSLGKEKLESSSSANNTEQPSHISVFIRTSDSQREITEDKSKYMKIMGNLLRNFLTRFWIAVVSIMLFTSGITGSRMTVFRIIYMSLFLFFVITFQISWRAWRRMMYGFWITVIGYSITMLILVYTYQFRNFPSYWEYLHINKELQNDIGLETYETKDLFIRLSTPTFFVIVTVIQIHCFHEDFLKITNLERQEDNTSRLLSLGDTTDASPIVTENDIIITESEERSAVYAEEHSEVNAPGTRRIKFFKDLMKHLNSFYNYLWLYLELHVKKIIFISLMALCANDVCAINFLFVIALVIIINLRRKIQVIGINVMAILIAILMVIKMLYQIEYIQHDKWDVNCTNNFTDEQSTSSDKNSVHNIAEWIGMEKAAAGALPNLLKGYIGIIIVTTLRAIIKIRQRFYRKMIGESPSPPKVMFPDVTRADADGGIVPCLKFLLNYGFYKFGMEFCFIAIAIIIGTRLDFYSALYNIWLIILFSLKRRTISRLWPLFRLFVIILLPFQYCLMIVPPSWLCIQYPRKVAEILDRLQEWMHLPDPYSSLEPNKLICDFILLLMIVRQSLVFKIEDQSTSTGSEFIAGHNYSVYQNLEKVHFTNPVGDYVSRLHNWLDVLKRGIFMSLLWINLSFMFLAGTERTNIFSLGYLIGAFVFLWQGSDLYLRPVRNILKWWNSLILYNIIVIFSKTLLHGIGCILLDKLEHSVCWLIQLLDISCSKGIPKSEINVDNIECRRSEQDIGIFWDILCFGFLLMQKRLFKSYYFFHIVDETKAMSILASRGAELFEELHHERIREQGDAEKAVLEKVKSKMDRIKANQRRIQGPDYKEPSTHVRAIRSGDYYMFNDLDDDVSDLMCDERSRVGRPEDQQSRRSKSKVANASKNPPGLISYTLSSEKSPGIVNPSGVSSQCEIDKDEREYCKGYCDEREKKKKVIVLFTYFKLIWMMLNKAIISITKYLNHYSKNYRYIRKILAKEKDLLKAKPDFRIGTRLGINQIWQPISILQRGSINSHVRAEEMELSEVDQPAIIQLAASIWFIIIAHSTTLCYFMIFLHQIKNASIISTPLPLMVFFWGSLTIPRPSKTFWVTLIAYTEIIVIVKCIFQLEVIPWNQRAPVNNPFYGPRIFGVERKPNYALWDLLVLLVVFFHRFILKSLGQWTNDFPRTKKIIPSKSSAIREKHKSDEDKVVTSLPTVVENAETETIIEVTTSKIEAERNDDTPVHTEQPHSTHGEGNFAETIPSEEADPLDERNSKISNKPVTSYTKPMKMFFKGILDPMDKEKTNIYAYMFFCDFFNFLLLIFGFPAFGTYQEDGGVKAYLEENRIPMSFLLMLLFQFALIVIDRALFLKKSILGKLIFQYCLIVGVHIWMFFILPSITERQFVDNLPPQIWYMIKCFYLLLAAHQLKRSYPTRILGNFLCKKYNIVNYFLFKGFMVVPLLFELRAVMDWIWTDTSMTIMDWFKMEDIYANIYQLKCMRGVETNFPQPRGQKKAQMSKYMTGGAALFLIIALVWFPLLFFALGRTVGVANLPYKVSLEIRIGAYQPLYSMSARDSSIIQYNKEEYEKLTSIYARDRSAVTFLENYVNTDVAAVRLSGSSGILWPISPPDKERLEEELASNKTMTIHVEWSVSRKTDVKDFSGITKTQREIKLPAYVNGEFNVERQKLLDMLSMENGTNCNSNSSILILNVFPKFLKVTNRITNVVPQLMKSSNNLYPGDDSTTGGNLETDKYVYRNISLQIASSNSTFCSIQQWWKIKEDTSDDIYQNLLSKIPLNDQEYIVIFLFNEKAFPESLSFISGYGILGLYSLFLYVISQVIRKGVSDVAPKIMFEDLPYVDRILRLCLDIYLVRENKDLCLEEDLFAKLIFLYRSPETLIRWTRPPEFGERSGDGRENYILSDDQNPDVSSLEREDRK